MANITRHVAALAKLANSAIFIYCSIYLSQHSPVFQSTPFLFVVIAACALYAATLSWRTLFLGPVLRILIGLAVGVKVIAMLTVGSIDPRLFGPHHLQFLAVSLLVTHDVIELAHAARRQQA